MRAIKKFYHDKIRKPIQIRIDIYVIKRFVKLYPKKLIKDMYHKMAIEETVVDVKEVHVKKGKVRYTLVVAKDKDHVTCFNLGKYPENLEGDVDPSVRRQMEMANTARQRLEAANSYSIEGIQDIRSRQVSEMEKIAGTKYGLGAI